ncbi:Ephrin_rec_like domain-containing protein, partial [Durusdinium trenchii]
MSVDAPNLQEVPPSLDITRPPPPPPAPPADDGELSLNSPSEEGFPEEGDGAGGEEQDPEDGEAGEKYWLRISPLPPRFGYIQIKKLTRDLLGTDKDLVTGESNNDKRYALICMASKSVAEKLLQKVRGHVPLPGAQCLEADLYSDAERESRFGPLQNQQRMLQSSVCLGEAAKNFVIVRNLTPEAKSYAWFQRFQNKDGMKKGLRPPSLKLPALSKKLRDVNFWPIGRWAASAMVKPWNVWWLFIWIATSEPAPCLPDAVKAEERRWLKDNAGRDLPLGLLTCDWASSMLFTSLTDILIQEVLGYHAFISPASLCGSTPHQLYASFGCTEFNHEEARDCENETRIHVTMDSWITGYPTELDTMKSKYPHLAPSDLGSMGYDGHESVFLQMRSRAAAAQQGLALAYY